MLGFGNQTRLAETNEEDTISGGGSFRATTGSGGLFQLLHSSRLIVRLMLHNKTGSA
jgi:hypothetical protein